MHTLKLNIHDSLYDKVFHFLNSLPKNKVEIVESKTMKKIKKTLDEESVDVKLFSNHSANLIDEWKDSAEDDVWK